MIEIETSGGLFVLRSPYDPRIVDVCKGLRGRYHKKTRTWAFPASPYTAATLAASFRSYHMKPDVDFTGLAVSGLAPLTHGDIPLYKTKPWDHQTRSFWYVVDRWGGLDGQPHGGAGLALGMGCGKTKITLDLIQNFKFKRVLVICPSKVVDVWPYQWKLHGAVPARVLPLSSRWTTARRAKEMSEAMENQSIPLIVVTNYEALNYKPIQDAVKRADWDLIVLDEIHRIKNPQGKTSKVLHKISDGVPCRLGLTGTPMPNGPLDIFASSRFLDWGYFSESFVRFRSEYAIMGGYAVNGKPVQILGYKNEDDLAARMALFWLNIRSEDVLDLPGCKDVMVPVELEPKTKKAFDQMWDQFVVWISEDEEVTAANVLVKLLKAQEITGGYLRNPETGTIHRIGTEKQEALQEILADVPEDDPFVCFCRFHHDLDNIHALGESLGRKVYEVSGRKNELKAWQEASGGELLACQIASGKEGVDMTRARYAAFYSLGFQPGEFEQAKKRLDRPGQTRPVTLWHLCAKDTVDGVIYGSIARKQKVTDGILKEVRDAITT